MMTTRKWALVGLLVTAVVLFGTLALLRAFGTMVAR